MTKTRVYRILNYDEVVRRRHIVSDTSVINNDDFAVVCFRVDFWQNRKLEEWHFLTYEELALTMTAYGYDIDRTHDVWDGNHNWRGYCQADQTMHFGYKMHDGVIVYRDLSTNLYQIQKP